MGIPTTAIHQCWVGTLSSFVTRLWPNNIGLSLRSPYLFATHWSDVKCTLTSAPRPRPVNNSPFTIWSFYEIFYGKDTKFSEILYLFCKNPVTWPYKVRVLMNGWGVSIWFTGILNISLSVCETGFVNNGKSDLIKHIWQATRAKVWIKLLTRLHHSSKPDCQIKILLEQEMVW